MTLDGVKQAATANEGTLRHSLQVSEQAKPFIQWEGVRPVCHIIKPRQVRFIEFLFSK